MKEQCDGCGEFSEHLKTVNYCADCVDFYDNAPEVISELLQSLADTEKLAREYERRIEDLLTQLENAGAHK